MKVGAVLGILFAFGSLAISAILGNSIYGEKAAMAGVFFGLCIALCWVAQDIFNNRRLYGHGNILARSLIVVGFLLLGGSLWFSATFVEDPQLAQKIAASGFFGGVGLLFVGGLLPHT